MSNTILLKRSAIANSVPATGNLSLGELALNTYDGKLFTKIDNGTPSVVDLTENQTITLSGAITGSGKTAITTTLANTAVTPGTYGNATTIAGFTVDSTGRLTNVTEYFPDLSAESIANGTSNVDIATINGPITIGVNGTSNVAIFNATGANISGTLDVTGNVSTGNVSGTNGVFTNITGTLQTAAQPNITSVGTLGSLTVTGNITGGNLVSNALISGTTIIATGNITGGNITTDGLIAANGTITGGNLYTTGSLTSGPQSITGNVDVTGNINVTGNLNYANVNDLVVGDPLIYIGANNTGNVYDLGMVVSWDDGTYQHGGWVRDASDGTWKLFGNVINEPTTTIDFTNAIYQPMLAGSITSNATVAASGNITGANLNSNAGVFGTTATFTGNVDGGNLITLGYVSATGNVSGNYIIGNGSLLTGIITGTQSSIANGTSNVAIAVLNGNVTVGVAGVSNVAVFSASGLDVTGNIYGTDVYKNGVTVLNANDTVDGGTY